MHFKDTAVRTARVEHGAHFRWLHANESQQLREHVGQSGKQRGRKLPRRNQQKSVKAVKITLEDALSLQSKYADECMRVLAVLGSASVSIVVTLLTKTEIQVE